MDRERFLLVRRRSKGPCKSVLQPPKRRRRNSNGILAKALLGREAANFFNKESECRSQWKSVEKHPGNIYVDDVNGGRFTFYDFGMMGSASTGKAEGLKSKRNVLKIISGIF